MCFCFVSFGGGFSSAVVKVVAVGGGLRKKSWSLQYFWFDFNEGNQETLCTCGVCREMHDRCAVGNASAPESDALTCLGKMPWTDIDKLHEEEARKKEGII